ncbi:MAG TPA: hypothetical protein VGD78_22015 [Chthoniobacterales bacterium]
MFHHLCTGPIRPKIGHCPKASVGCRCSGFPPIALVLIVVTVFGGSPTSVSAAVDDTLAHPKRIVASTDRRDRPADTVCTRVERTVRADRSSAPEIVTRELALAGRNPINYTGQIVQAALCGLGPEASADGVGRMVFAAVKARPTAVLEVVRVAISGTRRTLHRSIVSAAVAGVPDPTVRVVFQPVKVVRAGLEADLDCHCAAGQGYGENKTAQGYRSRYSGANAAGYVSASGQGYSLAESVLEAALEAGSNENQTDLSSGIDGVLENRRNAVGDLVVGSTSGAEQGTGAFGNGINGGQSLNGGFGGLGTSLSFGAAPPAFGGLTPGPTPSPVSP